MAVDDTDGFEEELVVRLGEQAEAVSGAAAPLAELRRAGERRARRTVAVRVAAGAAVLAVGVGGLSQLGGGGGAGAGLAPAGVASSGPGSTDPFGSEDGPVLACTQGPTSLRTPGWVGPSSGPSGGPSGAPSSGFPSTGVPSSGITSTGFPSSGITSSGPGGAPSPGGPFTGWPSAGSSSSGGPFTGVPSSTGVPSTGAPATWTGLPVPTHSSASTGPSGRPATGSPTGSPTGGPTGSPTGGAPSSGLPSPSASAGGGGLLDTPAGRAAVEIRTLASQRYPDQYFGVCVDPGAGTVHVLRVPGGGFDQAVRDGVRTAPVTVAFRDAAGSRRQAREVLQRITADAEYWRGRGQQLFGTLAGDGAGVMVYVTDAAKARDEVVARYGPLVAEVRQLG
ncbi:hypothetical protein [Kitasatospora sp. NPDC090091]|uniref:hypothetical protein n=1 Tax=Kitasatospora sp. NPDC090091 TaxID=3364081 RepID=UPI0038197635